MELVRRPEFSLVTLGPGFWRTPSDVFAQQQFGSQPEHRQEANTPLLYRSQTVLALSAIFGRLWHG